MNLSEKDLYRIAEWGLTGEYEYSSCWNEDLEKAIECAIEDFRKFLSKPYPFELADIPNNPIIYRLVRLDNIEKLNRTKLGKSWFANPKQIKKPEFFEMLTHLKPGPKDWSPNSKVYLIKGRTTVDNIDFPRTLWERSTQWWENEIVLLNDSNIEILDVQEFTMDMYLRESIRKILRESKESEEFNWAVNLAQKIQKRINREVNDNHKYVFIKDLNGSGFSESFKTMDELIKKYGDWVNVDWYEIEEKLDEITDADIIRWNDSTFTGWLRSRRIMIKSARDTDNRWGYNFYVQKLLKQQ